jgi:hypothetical protein
MCCSCCKPIPRTLRFGAFSVLLALAALCPALAGSTLQPYTADAGTLHLWHLDETATPCVDAVSGGTNLTYAINGATPGSASFSNSAAVFTNCIRFGTLTASNAVIFPIGSGNVGTPIPFTYAGTSGAFTYEAVVHIEFNPTNFVRSQPCQIMNCDADGTGTRVFQFRLDPVGFAAGGRNTNFVGIEFINGTTVIAVAPIPTNGPDVIVSNAWYHVAVTYNGSANTTSNLLFYWTLLDTNRAAADCIYGTNMTSDLPGTYTATTIFSIGNSARNPSGGTGPAVANFLGKIDEVRLSSVARGADEFVFIAADADGDGLPDTWETTYFTNITAYGAADDPDADGYSNLQEYEAGSNPANILSTPLDTEADGLPDAWETTYFSTLTYGAADDPDSDGYTNLQEYQGGTNPNNAASNPGDTDADGLPDAWESTYFGTLAYGVNDDYDGDGYTNLQEYRAGTLPNNANSHPALPVTTYIPIDDGNTNTSEYGYAGDPTGNDQINGVAFIRSGLITVSNQQFIIYYYRHETSSSDTNNNRIVVARRNLGTNRWDVFHTTFTAVDINDGHDVASAGIDGNGYLHLSWGMHGNSFLYAKSTGPVTGSNSIAFGSATTMTGGENNVTYPQFLTLPGGDLLFIFREGTSGAGDTFINRYNHAAQTWTNQQYSAGQQPFIKGTWTNTTYNCYPNMPCLDAEGNLHFIWVWRETSAYLSNHDFSYAKSTNGGITWLRSDGTPYALPISDYGESGDTNTIAERILDIPQNSSLINQAGMCLETNNKPVVASWWAPGTATNNYRRQYLVLFNDTNGTWQARQVSSRTNDSASTIYGDTYVRNLARPVVVCDKQDRIIVLYRDNAGSNGLTVVSSLPGAVDPNRLLWTSFDLTTDNLGCYEPVIDNERWARDNVLDIFYQPGIGQGYTAPSNNAAPIGVLEWDAAAWFAHQPAIQLDYVNSGQDAAVSFSSQTGWGYRLWASTNIVNHWQAAGSIVGTVTGNGSQLQMVHTNGAVGPQRYWRLEIKEGGF